MTLDFNEEDKELIKKADNYWEKRCKYLEKILASAEIFVSNNMCYDPTLEKIVVKDGDTLQKIIRGEIDG